MQMERDKLIDQLRYENDQLQKEIVHLKGTEGQVLRPKLLVILGDFRTQNSYRKNLSHWGTVPVPYPSMFFNN